MMALRQVAQKCSVSLIVGIALLLAFACNEPASGGDGTAVQTADGAVVEGFLVSADGEPAVNHSVLLFEANSSLESGHASVTDANGYFRIAGIQAGTYTILAGFDSPPGDDFSQDVDLDSDDEKFVTLRADPDVNVEPRDDWTVPSQSEFARLDANVLTADGSAAAPPTTVALLPTGSDADSLEIAVMAPVDDSGRAYIESIVPGEYLIVAEHHDADEDIEIGPESLQADSTTEVTLQMEYDPCTGGRELIEVDGEEKCAFPCETDPQCPYPLGEDEPMECVDGHCMSG